MKYITIKEYQSRFGELILGSYEGKLCLCDWKYRKMRTQINSRICKLLGAEFRPGTDAVIEQTIRELDEYISYKRKEFSIPLLLVGTDFQKSVWESLLKIPFGKTSTYKKQSELLGNPKAIRAVATANGANAISIIVPCHRILGSDGKLIGYAGGLSTKKRLLELEQDLFISTPEDGLDG